MLLAAGLKNNETLSAEKEILEAELPDEVYSVYYEEPSYGLVADESSSSRGSSRRSGARDEAAGEVIEAALPDAAVSTSYQDPLFAPVYSEEMLAAASGGEDNDSKKSELQKMVDSALGNVKGILTGKVTVELGADASYDGEVELNANGRTVADDFELEFATANKADEADSTAGVSTYTGAMNIKGINVTIRGIGLKGMVKVDKAKLNYTGTDKADTVNVTAGAGARVSVKTGQGADTVTANANGGDIDVDTGADDDTVTSEVNEGSAAIRTGDGNDSVTATFSGDKAPVKMDIDSGAGDDRVKLTNKANRGTTQVFTGEGDDTVEVDVHSGGNGGVAVHTDKGDDSVTLTNTGSIPLPIGKVDVSLGEGNDMATVDMSLSDAVTDVKLRGGEGRDAVNFTGTLGNDTKEYKRVEGDAKNLKLVGAKGRRLNVTLADMDRLTDTLNNKETIVLTPEKGVLAYKAERPAINYQISIPARDIKNLKVTSKDGKDLLLSNVVINIATEVDGENRLVIGEGTIIDVRGLKLVLDSRDIEINGTIVADDVNITANAKGKLLNLQAGSRIVINDTAAIYSSGDVMILAKATLSGPMLDSGALGGTTIDLAPINSINVKIAHASVDIAGKVYAGVTRSSLDAIAANPSKANPQIGKNEGSVTASAETSVAMGVDSEGKPLDSGWPVAVSVANVEASVDVRRNAVIEAARNVTLASKSTLKAGTRASSGLAGAPAAVAVAVLINDVHTTVEGKVTAHNGNAEITADGILEATTVADRGSGQKMISGGYAAVSVALQDVKAVLGSHAVVTAGGDVIIHSNATEKVVDRAAASAPAKQAEEPREEDDSLRGKAKGLLLKVKDKLLSWVKGKIDQKTPVGKKITKALKLLPVSDKSVVLDSNAQQKGQVTADLETENGKTRVKLNLEPWEGYEVKSITVRGYFPGQNFWNVKTLTKQEIAGKKQVELDGVGHKMFVFVEYEEKKGQSKDDWQPSDLFGDNAGKNANQDEAELDEDAWRPSDLFDLDDMMNDVQNGTEGEDDKQSDGKASLKLCGGVLTYDYLPGSPDKNLDKVSPGDAVRLIPNPETGKKLKEGTLKATYTVREKVEKDGKEEEKDVEKVIVVTPDDQGRYILNVPETFEKDKGISISAEFENGAQEEDADQTQTQLTGSVAVSVAHNDSQVLITENARVVAGGKVDTESEIRTDVDTNADGTAVSKEAIPAPGSGKPKTYPISRPKAADKEVYADNSAYIFGVKVDRSVNGTVEFKADQDPKKLYAYIITPKPHAGYDVASATLTYYKGGNAHTVSLKKADDGTYRIELEKSMLGYYTVKEDCCVKTETSTKNRVVGFMKDLFANHLGIDKGSNIVLNFTFASAKESGVFHESYEAKTVQPHIINIKYKGLKADKDTTDSEKNGTIAFNRESVKTEGGKTYYVFTAKPEKDRGYELDGKLKATWEGSKGVELEPRGNNLWYLDASKLPDNQQVTVTGAFKAVFHNFKKKSDTVKNGSVILYDEKVKKADAPRFTVRPDKNYAVQDIVITYTKTNAVGMDEKVTLKLSDAKSKITKVKDLDNVYTFTVGDMKEGSEVNVDASFKLKTIGVFPAQSDRGKYRISEENVAIGDKVTVSLNDADVASGKKISEVKVEVEGKPSIAVKVDKDNSFVVPKGLKDTDKLIISSVTTVNKEVPMEAAKLGRGSVTPDVAYADKGETVTVTVRSDKDFTAKKGTLKAVLRSEDGSYTEEVMLRRQSDTSYAFTMPTVIPGGKKFKLTFEGEFVPGNSDSSQVDTSLGAGIAVSVVNSEGRADVRGRVTAGDVDVKSTAAGGVTTETKAGYSAGLTGVGGAVSVQVASVDSKALVHETADLNLKGALSVDAQNQQAYRVNADATGNKNAKKTGVGAGIAVAVNGGDTYAAVRDDAKLSGELAGIAVTAARTLTDTVGAKAGAKGGSAGVPVAVVDVIGGNAEAYMGRVSDKRLSVAEDVTVSARNIATHGISANASAAGQGVGVGAAVGVSVVSDKANARLNQSVDAKSVKVNTETESRLNSTATAGASGGESAKSGGKKPDAQADGLLGVAGKLAGKNGSDSVSQGDIEKASSKNRQKAETSEGSVAVAGAVAVNVQSSTSHSEIMKGVDVKSAGELAVTTLNGTTASVKANASTTHSDVGVGVGVAVNIVALHNVASLSDGEIEAAMLKVAANTKTTKPKAAEGAKTADDKASAEQKAKEEAKKVLAREVGSAVKGYMNDLIVAMGLDQYVSASLIGDIADKVSQETTQSVLKAMGLDKLVGTKTFDEIFDASKAAVRQIVRDLESMPDALTRPIQDVIDRYANFKDALGNLTDAQKQSLKKVLGNNIDPGNPISVQAGMLKLIGTKYGQQMKKQAPELPARLLMCAKDGMVEYLKENVGGILSGLYQGREDASMSKLTEQVGRRVMKSVSGEVQQIMSTALQQAVTDAATEVAKVVPDLNVMGMVGAVSDSEAGSGSGQDQLQKVSDEAGEKVTAEFEKRVPYGELFEKLSKYDFKTKIIEGLRAGAKTALVTLSNESLNALSEHFDLSLEAAAPEPVGHIIDTQAISGAGAKDVGVAGSVAVTVLNAETSATIADSSKNVTVSGDMTLSADELRKVNNVASAAVNAKGEAEANLGAGKAETSEAGGREESDSVDENEYGDEKKPTVRITVGVGGTGEILQGEKARSRPGVYITLDKGYKMPSGNAVAYTYTDKNGKEVKGTVAATRQENGAWYVDTRAGELARAGDEALISLSLKPEENLHSVKAPMVPKNEADVSGSAVTVSVKDREVKDDAISARAGDLVQIRVDREKSANGQVKSITYKCNNQTIELMLNKDGKPASGNTAAYAMVSSDEKEQIYTFTMPDGDVTDIEVNFQKAEKRDDTPVKDETGKTVGVGAAFSMVYGKSGVNAGIAKRNVRAGALSMSADSGHTEKLAAVAGTDPLGADANPEGTKEFALDASVALNILDNDIAASVAKNASITTTGYKDKKDGQVAGDLKVTANETSAGTLTASAFSAGGSTAVGASVAVNVSNSRARALLESGASVDGSATVAATGSSADVTRAVATALGADIARGLSKLNAGAQDVAAGANKLMDGSAAEKLTTQKDKPKGTDTNKRIVDRLNDSDKKDAEGSKADESLSLSQNVLRSLGVKTESENAGKEGTGEGIGEINKNTEGSGKLKDNTKGTSSKIQVGAAVGVNVTKHEMQSHTGAITANGDITATARNTGNFNTQGTGAAMSFAKKANSIAAGVAVSVNTNTANVRAEGDLISNNGGKVTADARLTQNLTGEFAGKLATQAVAGSAAGGESKISLGGAVSVLVSKGAAEVSVAGGTGGSKRRIAGGDVTIESVDKSRLTARAGGISLSKDSSVGMGIASNVITSSNSVKASVGDNTEVEADSFRLNADKQAVTAKDFKQLINLRTLVTDSSKLTDEQRANAKTGLIDYHKGKGEDNYTASVNLSTDKLLGLMDGMNILSGRNTYAEAVAGSISTGSTTANIAGSVAVAVNKNDVQATMGDNVTVNAKQGNVVVNAGNGATTRIIAGSVSAAPATTSVGATVAVLVNNDSVMAKTGANAQITASGDMKNTANQTANTELFTGAMSVATGKSAKAAVGGAVNVIVNKSVANSIIGRGSRIKVDGDADVHSRTKMDLTLISGSVNAGTGKVAAGGTVNVIVDKAKAATGIGNNTTLEAGNNASITSDISNQMISGVASASVAASMGGISPAGAINVIVARSVANTSVGKGAKLTASRGDLKLNANNDAMVLNATLAAAGAGGTAIGGAFNVNVFNRLATVNMVDGTLSAGGNLLAQSSGRDSTVMAGLAIAGGVSGVAVAGNADVLVENNRISTNISRGVTAEAAKSAVLESYYSDYTTLAAGSIALSGSPAVGATVLTVVKKNDVQTLLNESSITAHDAGIAIRTLNGTKVNGTYVGANASETQFLGAAGVVASGSSAVNGVVDVLVNDNTVIADASRAKLAATQKRMTDASGRVSTTTGGSIAVKASDDTRQTLLAGGVSASAGAGVGASVVTLVSNKTVKALAHDMEAQRDAAVNADNQDNVTTIAVSVGGGSVGVQIGAAVQVLKSRTIAEVGSTVSTVNGNVKIGSVNNAKLNNAAAALAGAAGAAVIPVGVVTYFTGDSIANLKSGSTIKSGKNVSVTSEGKKEIGLYSVGASASGAAGVSGTANVIVSKDRTRATVAKDTSIETVSNWGKLDILANSDYDLTSATASVGAGGAAGVAVNAVVSVLKSQTLAELAGKVNLGYDLNVKARSTRNVTNVGANLAAGTVGVGVNVMVLVAGTKMSQDAADMMARGGAENGKTFDAGKLMNTVAANDRGGSRYYQNDVNGRILAEDTAGNGRRESGISVGGTNGSGKNRKGTFDGASGYRDSDFDNQNYNDRGNTKRGENLKATDTGDIANAKKLNTYTYTDDPEDAVIARITNTAEVERVKDLTVSAEQPVTADLFGATVSAGAVGVGVTAAVAILHSNVLASSMADVHSSKDGDVTVTATSRSNGNVANRSNALKKLLKGIAPEGGGIRAIGATATGGAVGVAVGAGVVLTDNITQAKLGGNLKKRDSDKAGYVTVEATQDYGNITSAVGTFSAGAVAIGASVGVAQSNATVTAQIEKNTEIDADRLIMTNTGNQRVNAMAATAGAGGVAVNAGVALAINRMKQNTVIGRGTKVNAKRISVRANSDTVADSGLLGISIGGAGVALGAAVSQVNAKVNTSVENATLNATDRIDMVNEVSSTATPKAVSLAGGGVAAGGNVLLAFNDSDSRASITGSKLDARYDVIVIANLKGKAESKLAAAQVGGAAVGLSVNYADMRAINRAVIDDTDVKTENLVVRTGKDDRNADTSAVAETVAGGMGFYALNRNAAIARNNSRSYAVVDGGNIVASKGVTMRSYQKPTANARVDGVNAGALAVATNVVVALNDASTRVKAHANRLESKGPAEFTVSSVDTADAKIVTGGGALFKADASIGVGYGRANSIVDVNIGKLTAKSLKANSTANSSTSTNISNGSYAAVKAGLLMGAAFSQDVVNTKVKLGNGSSITDNTAVQTNYDIRTDADVTPHSGGVDASLAKMGVNLGAAKSTAYAGSDLIVNEGTVKANAVEVKTQGSGSTNAIIRPTRIQVSGVKLGANKVTSDLSMTESAMIHLNRDSKLDATGNVFVEASAKQAEANAKVGNSGANGGYSISLINADLSFADARENMASTAGIKGAANAALNGDRVRVKAEMSDSKKSKTYASSNEASNYSLMTLGNLDSKASSSDRFSAIVDNVAINAKGRAEFYALTDTTATAEGGVPGGFAIIDGGKSYTQGDIGASNDYQTARVLFGNGVKVNADKIDVLARNRTTVNADMKRGGSFSLAKVESSSQPTHTWVDTSVVLGRNVELNAKGRMEISTRSEMKAESIMRNESKGVILNVVTMKGDNSLTEKQNLLIGQGSKLTSGANMLITAQSTANMNAETVYKNESYGVIGKATGEAVNRLDRTINLMLEDDVNAKAGGLLDVWSCLGKDDKIRTYAKETVRSFIELPRSKAVNDANLNNIVSVGAVNLTAGENLYLYAHTGGKYEPRGDVDAATTVKLRAKPMGTSLNNVRIKNNVNMNRGGKKRAYFKSTGGAFHVQANLENLWLYTSNFVEASGVTGSSRAECINNANIDTAVFVDNAQLDSRNGTHMRATFGDKWNTFFEEKAEAATYGVGSETALTRLEGYLSAIIKTNRRSAVNSSGNFTHVASNLFRHNYENKCSGWWTSKGHRDREWRYGSHVQCYFCYGTDVESQLEVVNSIPQNMRNGALETELRRTLNTRPVTNDVAVNKLNAEFSKALATVDDVNRKVDDLGDITKARYGAREDKIASMIYVMDIETTLQKDVTLDTDKLSRYRLWTNALTQHDVSLLHNSTRLYKSSELDYVCEILRGDVFGNGESHLINVFNALNENAFQNPVIPIGSAASLNFSNGEFSLPARADYALYLSETSGEWLLDQFNSGFMRRMDSQLEPATEYAVNNGEALRMTLPTGAILESVTEDGKENGWKRYWLGDTPKTAQDDAQILIGMLYNAAKDEVDFFRTSKAMLAAGKPSIDVSLFVFRDSKSDRRGEEKYNVMFYDTPRQEKSKIRIITDVLEDRVLELPRALRVVLHSTEVVGADAPVYSMNGSVYILCDANDGQVSLFNGFYYTTFDRQTFESDYLRIENIVNGDLSITIKRGQPVWPEKTGENHAEDLNGIHYEYVDDAWQVVMPEAAAA